MKLLEHFKAMQAMASRYLEPAAYDRTYPNPSQGVGAMSDNTRMDFFISDMLHMLDGPEQRLAQAEAETLLEGLRQAEEWRMDLRKQIARSDADSKHWKGAHDKLLSENNELRDRLMASELAYAKLTGYLDRIDDERPPVMVPQERERFGARMPDGTMGTETVGWRGGQAYGEPRRWFHR